MSSVAAPAASAGSDPHPVHVLYAPKEGNADDQYEDAYAITKSANRVTIAVADGASSAVFAREWAILLTQSFANDPTSAGLPEREDEVKRRIGELGKSWRESVQDKATSWYAQEKLPQGSSAALLVVQWDLLHRTFRASSIGDVCLFVVRDNRLKYAFPLTKSTKFDDRPYLVTTEIASGATKLPPVTRFGAPYEPEDRFLILTDAWAAYFLTEWEARRKPWNELPPGPTHLARWLKQRRDSGKLKNDDVTLVDLTL